MLDGVSPQCLLVTVVTLDLGVLTEHQTSDQAGYWVKFKNKLGSFVLLFGKISKFLDCPRVCFSFNPNIWRQA